MNRFVPTALAFTLTVSAPLYAAEPPTPATPQAKPVESDLQGPENVSVRYSAYSLPRGTWGLNFGALGIGGGDAYAEIGAAYGLGAGLDLGINLAHAGVGLLNLSSGWQFLDTRHFDLGLRVGVWYGHGSWFWIARGYGKDLIDKVDLVTIPLLLTASAPLDRYVELDLGAQYTYGSLFGTNSGDETLFSDMELGLRQFFFRPGVRVFVTDRTALELSAKVPVVTKVPLKNHTLTVPFSDTWAAETALRSRLARGFFANIRLHYGKVATALYGARLYPSFELEVRF